MKRKSIKNEVRTIHIDAFGPEDRDPREDVVRLAALFTDNGTPELALAPLRTALKRATKAGANFFDLVWIDFLRVLIQAAIGCFPAKKRRVRRLFNQVDLTLWYLGARLKPPAWLRVIAEVGEVYLSARSVENEYNMALISAQETPASQAEQEAAEAMRDLMTAIADLARFIYTSLQPLSLLDDQFDSGLRLTMDREHKSLPSRLTAAVASAMVAKAAVGEQKITVADALATLAAELTRLLEAAAAAAESAN